MRTIDGITGTDDHRGSGPHGEYVLQNMYVHDNMIVSRITEPGSGRTGIIDTDLVSALVSGNNRFENNQYVLGNPSGNYFIWFGERVERERHLRGLCRRHAALRAAP